MSTSDPDEPAGERTGEPLSLDRLLATYTAWSSADVIETARRRAHDAGDTERASALEAMAARAPSPLKALAAAHEVTSLLAGWRWHTVRAAREAGATWDDIAAATGTDPATARAEFLERVERASEQATAAGFEFRDEQRYRDAARVDTAHDAGAEERTEDGTELDPDDWTHHPIDRLDPESSTMTDDDQQQHDGDEQVRAQAGWPVPDLSRPLSEVSDRELIKRAELDEAVAMTGIGGDPDAAWADLDATRAEAERRAVDQPPDSIPAQVAGYISLVSEDHAGALHAEASSWRHDLDQALPPADTTSAAAGTAPAATRSIAQNAARAGARMSAEPPDAASESVGSGGKGFDLARLDQVTEQFGYAVFDPDAPGGVRAPSEREYADLLAELTPTPRTAGDIPADGAAEAVVAGPVDAAVPVAGVLAPGLPDTAEARVDEVERRTADPSFGYDPAAEWGDATYREPRTQDEADARTAHLATQRAADPVVARPELREPTELEHALFDVAEEATLADRAHDPDPHAWARYDDLLAVQDLRPTARPSAGEARYSGPEVEFEDQLFRRSLQHAVPADVADREQAIERAVDVARDRFWTHGVITYPEQALALSEGTDRGDDIDDPTRLRDLLEETRAQLAARDTADTAATHSADLQRREQLARWHHDDHPDDTSSDTAGAVGRGAGNDPLVIRCFGDPEDEGDQR